MRDCLRLRQMILCVMAIAALSLAACNMTDNTTARDGHWTHVQKTRNDKTVVIDYRDNITPEQLKDRPALFTASWHFVKADAQGLPGGTELAALNAFERELVAVLSKNETALLAAVITIDHQRDWYFYSRDAAQTENLVATQFRKSPAQSSVSIQSEPDAANEFSTKLAERVR
jgi:Family of unknown function (DUF695)